MPTQQLAAFFSLLPALWLLNSTGRGEGGWEFQLTVIWLSDLLVGRQSLGLYWALGPSWPLLRLGVHCCATRQNSCQYKDTSPAALSLSLLWDEKLR